MNRGFTVFIVLVSILVFGFGFMARTEDGALEGAGVSTGEGCYLGVFREGAPANMAFIESFERTMEKKPAMVMWYLDYTYDFPMKDCEKVDAYGAVPHIIWEPWVWGEEDKIKLDNIINGEYDDYIKRWANDAKEYGKTIFVRWGHEFNIRIYPWGIVNNAKDPKKYIKAYRHVHDIFKSAGAKNIKWIWCFNNYPEPDNVWNEWEKAYPGDDYVDWIGIDGYNWGTTQTWSGWETFRVLFRNQVRATAKKHPTKPIVIAEFGSAEDPDNENRKGKWVKGIPSALKISMKQVKAIVLFDVKKECDWRSTSSQATENAYREVFKDPYFLSDVEGLVNLNVKTEPFARKNAKAKMAVREIKIDGNLDDWGDTVPIVLECKEFLQEGESWSGNKDVSGKIYLMWDDDNLYIAADVVDDFPFSNSRKNGDIWNGDGIEIVISTDPSLSNDREYLSNKDFQIGFSTGDGRINRPSMWIWQKRRSPKGGEIKVIRKVNPQGYIMEAKVPWSELGTFVPKKGIKVGFNVAIDDADIRFEREAQLVWCGDFYFYKDPSVWGQLEFSK